MDSFTSLNGRRHLHIFWRHANESFRFIHTPGNASGSKLEHEIAS